MILLASAVALSAGLAVSHELDPEPAACTSPDGSVLTAADDRLLARRFGAVAGTHAEASWPATSAALAAHAAAIDRAREIACANPRDPGTATQLACLEARRRDLARVAASFRAAPPLAAAASIALLAPPGECRGEASPAPEARLDEWIRWIEAPRSEPFARAPELADAEVREAIALAALGFGQLDRAAAQAGAALVMRARETGSEEASRAASEVARELAAAGAPEPDVVPLVRALGELSEVERRSIVKALHTAGVAALAREHARSARRLFEGAIAAGGPVALELGATRGLASAHLALGDPAAADRALSEAVAALEPQGSASQLAAHLHDRGWARRRLGRHDAARDDFERARELWSADPRAASAGLGLGAILLDTGRAAEAVDVLRAALVAREQAGAGALAVAEARFLVAQALRASGAGASSAKDLAERAHTAAAAAGGTASDELRGAIERWRAEW